VADKFSGPDPFRREVKLELESVYYPLGFPLQLATNCAEVNNAAREIWGRYPQAFEQPPLRVRVVVEQDGDHPPVPVYRGQEHLMTITADARNFAVCDHTRHFAFCWLNGAAARDRQFTSYYFLEAIANYTLTQLYLTPVHGACVARIGRGVLLCGPSGAGKTSLAYFCARNGWTYISDNESWLVRSGAGVLLGNPHRIRFRDSARELFPELKERVAARDANGKMSIETAPMGGDTDYQCRVERVVLLARQPDGAATSTAIPPEQALEYFLSGLPIYDSRIREEQRASLERIAGLNPVELRYSQLDDAMRQLESLLI
jgi:hypothetical protein